MHYTDPTGHKWDECKEGQSDYLCKRHTQRAGKLKAHWKAQAAQQQGSCSSDSKDNHYCKLGNGAVIDVKHFNDDLARDFWNQLLAAKRGLTTTVTLTSYVGLNPVIRRGFTQEYNVNVKGMDKEQLKSVGAAIWWEYQIALEAWEGTQPLGNDSVFANNDIATTFMAYAATANDVGDFQDVLETFEGDAVPSIKVESENSSCMYTGICGTDTSRNTTIWLKAEASDGSWQYQTYPDPLNITPLFDHQYYSLK